MCSWPARSAVLIGIAFWISVASPVAAAEPSVGFTISARAVFPVKREGRFTDVAGELFYDAADPTGTRVNVTVYTASVDIENADQNTLLRSDKFFDSDHYPTMQFASVAATPGRDGTLTLSGDLTIRGITRRISTPATVHVSGAASILDTTFQIDRTDFGITGIAGWGGPLVSIGKKVQVHIAIAAAKRAHE